MNLKKFIENPDALEVAEKKVRRKEIKKRSSSGNSADEVLIYESERMANYISEENRQKIVSVRTALKYGVNQIGSKNDPAGILQKMLIPETTQKAKRMSAEYFFRRYHSDNIVFWSKNRFARLIEYERNGKTVSYWRGFNLKDGSIVKIPAKIKRTLGE